MANIAAINRAESLAQSAHKAMRRAIQLGDLVQEQLYSENEIAKSLGISRTPVREALIELEREGLVTIVPQRGFRLRVITCDEAQEVFELRKVVESFVTGRLAKEATPADIDRLNRLIDEQERLINDPEAFLACDEEFHVLMPRLIGLERSHQMLVSLRGALWLIGLKALALPERAADVVREHRALVEAIAAGDSVAAARETRSHLSNTSKSLPPASKTMVPVSGSTG